MWISNFIPTTCGIVLLILTCSSFVDALNEGKSTLLLYSTDLSSDNLISIQLDSITLNQIIADSEKQGRIVKKINFRDLDKLNELLNGKSTKFSFSDDVANSVCDISCNANCKVTTTTTPRNTPRPFVNKKDTVTGPPYLPPVSVSQKDEGITIPSTTKPTTTSKRTFTTTPSPVTTTTRIISTTTTRKPIADTEKPTTTVRVTTTSAPRISTTTSTTTRRPTTTTLATSRPSKSTPGPAYLPLARKTTFRPVTVSSRTTYPPATWPSFSTQYTQTYPTWTGPIRRFTYEPKSTTTTARYEYKEPSNALTYGSEIIDVRSSFDS